MPNQMPIMTSDWIERWTPLIQPEGSVLDVACGSGRHVRWFHHGGFRVTGVDISSEAIANSHHLGEMCVADLENGPWPLMAPGEGPPYPRQFDAVIVCNYLWRPLFPVLLASLNPGGVLLYETFAVGNEKHGRPSRPDFLLRPGELLEVCRALTVVAYEDVFLDAPPRCIQRIAAMAPRG